MSYHRILSAVRSAKWAIQPAALQAIFDTLGAHMRGSMRPRADMVPTPPGPSMSPRPDDDDDGPEVGVGVVRVHGIIGKHLSAMDMDCGGCDVDAVWEDVEEQLEDPSVTFVVLDIDSPGGAATGVPELAAKIREATKTKPIFAFTSATCCSAAYWIASACEAVFCTRSAELGSIGVYVALCDDSEWWRNEGYKLELVKAGEFKAMGISGQPLSDAERALIQADVDAIYAMFTGDVRAGRGPIESAVMQGQSFLGETAKKVGLVDEVVADMDDLIAQAAAG